MRILELLCLSTRLSLRIDLIASYSRLGGITNAASVNGMMKATLIDEVKIKVAVVQSSSLELPRETEEPHLMISPSLWIGEDPFLSSPSS